jgi:hypothetical protein
VGLVAVCVTAASVSGCSSTPPSAVPPPAWTPSPAATASPEPSVAEPTTTRQIRNDLSRLPLRRDIKAGPITLNLQYTTRLAVDQWRAGVSKPLFMTVTAINKRKRDQKIYLTKVTVNVTAYDEDGPVDGPRVLTDATNISPGFIVTLPNTYNQNFVLPAIDEAAVYLAIDVSYEMVLQVSKDKDGRNFSKQVATDSLIVPVAP